MIRIVKKSTSDVMPIPLADIKLHCRIDHSVEDSLLTLYAHTAFTLIEYYTAKPIVSTVFNLSLSNFYDSALYRDSGIYLPYSSNLVQVDSFKYFDKNNSEQVFTDYIVVGSDYKVIQYNKNITFPQLYGRADCIYIEYTSGYANLSTSPDVSAIKLATYIMVASMYENKEVLTEIPSGVKVLLNSIKNADYSYI